MQYVNSTVKRLFLIGLLLSVAVPRAGAQGACDRACDVTIVQPSQQLGGISPPALIRILQLVRRRA